MTKVRFFVAGAALAFAAACATTATSSTGDALDVRAQMQEQVNPAMLSIWEVTNNAMNDEGGVDPAQMDAGKWRQIAEGAERLAASGTAMAEAERFIAAAPDNAEVGEGEIAMADVQRHLDSDPRLFRQMAAAFAAHSSRLAEAARTQDAAAAGDLVAQMDGVCESCHARFWYPE